MPLIIAASLALAGCGAERKAEQAAPAQMRAPLPDDKLMLLRDDEHGYSEKSIFHTFDYVWPTGLGRLPTLRRRLQADMEKLRAETRASGGKTYVGNGGMLGDRVGYAKNWQTAGMNPRLASFMARIGYRPQSYEALLWDLQLDRRVDFQSLFADPPAFFQYVQPRMCRTLNLLRARRREPAPPPVIDPNRPGPKPLNLPCPAAASLVLAAKDSSGEGAFDTLAFLIPPGLAGPVDEGPYELDLPVEAAAIALLRPEYRVSFEVYQH